MGGVEGGTGRTTSKENHNQNLLSEKSLFTIKMGGVGNVTILVKAIRLQSQADNEKKTLRK